MVVDDTLEMSIMVASGGPSCFRFPDAYPKRYFLKFYFMDLMVLIQCLPPGFGGIQEILGLGLDIGFDGGEI
ncbi:hypothetical protein ACE6H2_021487 [Prunus campanulata]